jgi:transcriptional regulator with XRE-family HTH domain
MRGHRHVTNRTHISNGAFVGGWFHIHICYSSRMLHEQIREARIAHRLSQVKLAKLAQVPRSQLRKFENGHGITMNTFMKILSQLPNLKHLTLGPTDLELKHVDLGALSSTLTELVVAATNVLTVIQAANRKTASVPADDEE